MFTTFILLCVASALKVFTFILDYFLDEAIKQKEREESDKK